MSQHNPMTIRTFLDVAPLLPVHTSVLVRGPHGIGKSRIIRRVARMVAKLEKILEYEIIDKRLSQQTEGDVIGLPSTDGEVTRFNPPDWYKRACLKPCVLLLDEFNRATHEVMQAAFQIVLDRELNGWKLHPQTRVYACVNASAEYIVNEMDPALLDRFWVIDLKPDVKDWLIWAREPRSEDGGQILPVIIEWITNNEKFLDPPKNAEIGSINSSRRSVEFTSIALENMGVGEDAKNERFYHTAMGFLGTEAAISLTDFAKTYTNHVTGKDIVEHYLPKIRNKVKALPQDRVNGCIESVADYVIKNLAELTPKQGENVATFMKDLPGELRVSCWVRLTSQGLDKLPLAKSIHKYCVSSVLDVFGVPQGEVGVGVVPNIPGIFKAPASTNKK